MRNFIGLGMLAVGIGLIYTGITHKNAVLAARAAITARGETIPEPPLKSLATFGQIMRAVILFILCALALTVIFGYLMFDGGQFLSYLDLSGFLVAIVGYGFWLTMKTEHRASDLDRRVKPVEPSPEPTTEVVAPSVAPAENPAKG
jgi:amino acid permease